MLSTFSEYQPEILRDLRVYRERSRLGWETFSASIPPEPSSSHHLNKAIGKKRKSKLSKLIGLLMDVTTTPWSSSTILVCYAIFGTELNHLHECYSKVQQPGIHECRTDNCWRWRDGQATVRCSGHGCHMAQHMWRDPK